MAEGNDQEKTEPASAKKRERARRKGQLAVSREVPSVLILMSAMGVFYFAGGWMFSQLASVMGGLFGDLNSFRIDDTSTAHNLLAAAYMHMFKLIAPLFLTVAVAGIVGNTIQVGFLWTTETMQPKLSKLNPLSGLKRLFSIKSFVELLKSLLKVVFIGTVAFLVVRKEYDIIPGLMMLAPWEILSFVGRVAFKLTFFVCLALVALAGADYAFQKWKHEKDLRMSKQEVKDEQKQTHGDPLIKGRIRKAQRDMARQRMMAAVPKADVVITNPTRLAIALSFDPDQMAAPTVVAKGAGEVARRIREIADEHGVPRVEEKPLARALFKTTEIGDPIPVDLYKAVAEVLAYVYRLRGKTMSA